MLFITETWLHCNILDSIIGIPGYSLLRCDRKGRRGGGVCIYISNQYSYHLQEIALLPDDIEAISLICSNTIYTLLYIPPHTSALIKETLLKCLITHVDNFLLENPDGQVCFLGDFNNHIVHDLCLHTDVSNIVNNTTRGTSLLDYILVSNVNKNKFKVEVRDPLCSSDHRMIFVYSNGNTCNNAQSSLVYDLRSSNIDRFYMVFKELSWHLFYSSLDIDDMTNILEENIRTCLSVLPKKRVKLKSSDKPWITLVLKDLINRRWEAYKKRQFSIYNALKVKIQTEIRKAKQQWADNIKTQKPNNFWGVVKSENYKMAGLKALTQKFDTDYDAANHINSIFTSVFTPKNETIDLEVQQPSDSLPFTIEEVHKVCNEIDYKKAYGNCGIPNKVFRFLLVDILPHLTHLLNACLVKSVFPDSWKLADVIPLPKTNPPNMNKLRPISLLPLLCKVFEKLILTRIKPTLLANFDKCQYGFRPNSSTTCAIIKIRDATTRLLDTSNVDAVSIASYDLAKAFDTVDHAILLQKLKHIFTASDSNLYLLLKNFLTNRKQRVKIGTTFSMKANITSGVPQGSCLSPYLFNIYIADLQPINNVCLVKFADDSTFIIPHYSNSTTNLFQDTNNHMCQWASKNKISLNLDKTQIITIKAKSHFQPHPQSTDSILILGVTLSNTLKWNFHVDQIVKKCSSRLYLLRKLKPLLPKKDMITVFYAIIQSIIDYSSPAFAKLPAYLEHKLNVITRRAHYIICGHSCQNNCLSSPQDRRLANSVKLFKKAESNSNHILQEIMPHRLRRTNQVFIEVCNSTRRKNEFVPFMSIYCNENNF